MNGRCLVKELTILESPVRGGTSSWQSLLALRMFVRQLAIFDLIDNSQFKAHIAIVPRALPWQIFCAEIVIVYG